MRLSQKVFWIFFSITAVTLILALNQFAIFYSQQRFNQVVTHINKLQAQVRHLDQLRLVLLLPDRRFDTTEFERLVEDSSRTSAKLRASMSEMPSSLTANLDRVEFNLRNFSRSLFELADSRDAAQQLEALIDVTLQKLHAHNTSDRGRLQEQKRVGSNLTEPNKDSLEVPDLQLHYQVSAYLHHLQFERLPQIKKIAKRLKARYGDQISRNELDSLIQYLEQFYQNELKLTDRRRFVEISANNFVQLSQQMLSGLSAINTKKQRFISQITLLVSLFGVVAAIVYWYRIRIYIRRFLFNQNRVMQAIQTDSNGVSLAPQSKDELGQLTSTLKDLSVELKSKKADLLASEKKYRYLVESLSDWIWETNINHRFSYCNQAGVTVTGHSQATMLGRKYLTLSKGCEERSVIEHIEQHFRERTAFTNIERRIICADGTLKYLISSGTPLFDGEGFFIGFRGVDRDVSALVQAREAHDQLELKLQHAQKMESIGRLAGGVAHDFNNILSAIIGYTEVIMHRLEQDHGCFKYVYQIRKSGERAANLTKQLLAFSRKQVRSPRSLDLLQEVDELNNMLHRLVGEEISINVEAEDGLWLVKMDKSQLEQMIVNLSVNAKDAMPQGGQISISMSNYTLSAEEAETQGLAAGDYVRISFVDTGCGIAPDIQQMIFEPFFTTKEQGKGTGLGLAMVYGIVAQNNGAIQVESELGKGTGFRILLPRSYDLVDKRESASDNPKKLRRGTETVLFVEDEAVLLKMHCDFLQSLGYRVVPAVDGVDALQKYQDHPDGIDLLVTDIVMPNMGGIELSEKLLAGSPELKVLYLSGYTEHERFDKGILREGRNFIHKPVTPFDVVKMMEKILTSPVA